MRSSQACEIDQYAPMATIGHDIQTEQQLGLHLSDSERAAIHSACRMSGLDLDSYYRWYQQKSTISTQLAQLDRHSLLEAIRCIDRSDYSSINERLPSDRGVVIALPHHGHYILSAIRLMESIRHHRDVLIFYGDPTNHSGNELFDDLYRRLFDRPGCRAGIVHSNAKGIATALRALKSGAAVIMMPDVHRLREEAFCIPFLGRRLDVMLGTAAMARRTGSCILPVVSLVDHDFQATAVLGDLINPSLTPAPVPSDVSDYWTTLEIFRFLEREMGPQIIYWQYIRQHLLQRSRFPHFHPDTVDAAWSTFSKDQRTHPRPMFTACLD